MPGNFAGIVNTKLAPPQQASATLKRGNLIAALGESATYRIALLCAPAGYGKTILAKQYIESLKIPHGWVSLDPGDDNISKFLLYVVAALDSAYPGMCVHSRAALMAAGEVSEEVFAARLIQDLTELNLPLVLVLDDYHVIKSLRVHEFMNCLIAWMPETLQIVITTRFDPPLALTRLRGRSKLVEVRIDQLRFSATESEAYLRQSGTLPAESIAAMVRKGEGWPVGLNLLALVASGNTEASRLIAQGGLGNTPLIAEYFLAEVMETLPKAVQTVLCSMALPDRFSLPVCQMLVRELCIDSDSYDWLIRILRTKYFVYGLDPNGEWYNFHQLFRDFLLNRLRHTQPPAVIQRLYLSLSKWFADHQFLEEAIGYAVAADAVHLAAELIENHACEVMAAADWRRLGDWLEQLPEAATVRPGIQVCHAYYMNFRHRLTTVVQYLDEAEAALSKRLFVYADAQLREIQGSIWALRALRQVSDDPVEAQELANRALEMLPKQCAFQRSVAEIAIYDARLVAEPIRTVVTDIQSSLRTLRDSSASLRGVRLQLMICAGYYRDADLKNLMYAAREVRKLSEWADLPFGIGWAEFVIGWIYYQRNDLAAAERHFSAVWQNYDFYNSRAVIDALSGMLLIYHLQGDDDKGAAALKHLEQFVRQQHHDLGMMIAGALRWIADPVHAPMPPPHAFSVNLQDQFNALHLIFPVTIAIRRYAALGDPESLDSAKMLIESCLTNINVQRDVRLHVELLCCQALTSMGRMRWDSAIENLEKAVRLAAPRDAYRLIADAGRALTPLLHELLVRRVEPAFVEAVLELIKRPALLAADGVDSIPQWPASVPAFCDPDITLTPREQEILLLLARRFSDKEIAEQLTLSARTVQKHATNVYQKLHVNGRQQAVKTARSLGLID